MGALGWTEKELLAWLQDYCDLPALERFTPSDDEEDRLPARLSHAYQCLPISAKTNLPSDSPDYLHLITAWPVEQDMDSWVLATTGRAPFWYLGPAEQIESTLTQRYGVGSGSLDDDDLAAGLTEEANEQQEDEDAALIRFVNDVIAKAVTDRATDIHFEPQKETLQIRYRIDGALVPVRVPENLVQFQRAIISRLKIMAKLNISERRRPQDGRISFTLGREELDIRISTLPTMYGESVSLRLLTSKGAPASIEELGYLERDQNIISQVLSRPHGIVLATGPTGSGKSTSLSAFLRKIRDPKRRIITIEDPVEYEVDGVNQTQVHHDIGLTFAAALRSVLRQDPDVIMVGEIRDRETAEIAIRASLTGHLVLSTLHTNDAPGALTRLIDMEIEPFLIASSVELIIAQRLVRRLCPHCAIPVEAPIEELMASRTALKLPALPDDITSSNIYVSVGCDSCRGLGYRGRVGLFELLRVNEAIHELIVHKASARDIREVALAAGMQSLQSCGWHHVVSGLTTLEEVMRFADIMVEEEAEGEYHA
jgi:type II secretory ATPase GspE/PulE/Tfp pilus assembly ATPase PilB-like protein